MSKKIAIAPPTKDQLDKLERGLAIGQSLVTAACLAGIPQKVINTWIRYGRAGRKDFVPFVEAIDRAMSELSNAVVGAIYKRATEEEDLQALMWVYKVRLERREQLQLDRELAAEGVEVEAFDEKADPITEEDLEAAELRAMTQNQGH